MKRAWFLLFAVAAVSFGLGWLASGLARSAPPPEAPAPAPEAKAPPEPTRPNPVSRAMICSARHDWGSTSEPDCDAERLRNKWCETQLAQCEDEGESVRQQWPEGEGIESPEEWTRTVEEALDGCEIKGAELELVDCTEYPCVAGLRTDIAAGPSADDPEFQERQEGLIEAIRKCAPLRKAFGVGDEQDDALDIFGNDATCDDGSVEDFFVLTAFDPKGRAYQLLNKEDRTRREQRDMFRWLYRRGDDVSGVWRCEPK